MFTYKFRLIPNDFQTSLLWKHANTLNFFYNFFLSEKISNFQSNKTSISKSEWKKTTRAVKSVTVNVADTKGQETKNKKAEKSAKLKSKQRTPEYTDKLFR